MVYQTTDQGDAKGSLWSTRPQIKVTLTLTLLLYCLAQCGQQTGAEAMVPVSWVWVLSMGSGSPGAAGRSFLMLGGSSEPGWFFRMWAFLLLALLYTCRDTGRPVVSQGLCGPL